MNYSPLAIHCASLCLDVIQAAKFEKLNHGDIDKFHDDIYRLIKERTNLAPLRFEREHLFVSYVTSGVLSVLHQCLNDRSARDSVWILSALETRIDLSIKTILQ
ncbi:hypothetical protein VSVS12_03707 [Vibrio scophthalmi]|uniref:hypothetical protein n=1 Tax=Vibrio scophthalmi TaxID=45658 RepID=UPI00080931AF|nr:hypothetical protein [Vibrio scophthalmi]ANS87407.1 hypothetical protein VSVS12_03707 [Vibrio scophthalmi]